MECDECEFRLRCNIRAIKQMREARKNETGDEPIDREKVKALFENRLEGDFIVP